MKLLKYIFIIGLVGFILVSVLTRVPAVQDRLMFRFVQTLGGTTADLNDNSLSAVGAMASGITLGSGFTQFNVYYPTYSSNDYLEFYKTGSAASWTQVAMSAAGKIILSFSYHID